MSRGQSKYSERNPKCTSHHQPTALGSAGSSNGDPRWSDYQSLADLLGTSEVVVAEWAVCLKPVPLECVLRVSKIIVSVVAVQRQKESSDKYPSEEASRNVT